MLNIQDNATREPKQAAKRRPRQILEGHILTDDSTIGQIGGGMARPSPNYGTLPCSSMMMMMMMMMMLNTAERSLLAILLNNHRKNMLVVI